MLRNVSAALAGEILFLVGIIYGLSVGYAMPGATLWLFKLHHINVLRQWMGVIACTGIAHARNNRHVE